MTNISHVIFIFPHSLLITRINKVTDSKIGEDINTSEGNRDTETDFSEYVRNIGHDLFFIQLGTLINFFLSFPCSHEARSTVFHMKLKQSVQQRDPILNSFDKSMVVSERRHIDVIYVRIVLDLPIRFYSKISNLRRPLSTNPTNGPPCCHCSPFFDSLFLIHFLFSSIITPR